jgi:transcriptional antiterminator RfaH
MVRDCIDELYPRREWSEKSAEQRSLAQSFENSNSHNGTSNRSMIWSVAHTEAMRERVAQRFLDQAQFETYLPMINGKGRAVPLFPTYLFVRVGDIGWSRIDNTIGVLQLLRSSDKPARIGDDIVEAIRGQEKNGVVKLPEQEAWHVGDRVRISSGMFLGHVGLFDGMSARERVFVLLDLFGRKTRTEIAIAEIHKLELSKAIR